jgi:hypothetical protein
MITARHLGSQHVRSLTNYTGLRHLKMDYSPKTGKVPVWSGNGHEICQATKGKNLRANYRGTDGVAVSYNKGFEFGRAILSGAAVYRGHYLLTARSLAILLNLQRERL